MTPKTVSILTNPHPHSHIVYPYQDKEHIAEAVGIFAAAGISSNESVVLIATAEKQQAVESRLLADGFNVDELRREGRLIVLEADALLSELLESDQPNPEKFQAIIGDLIVEAKGKAPSGRVRLYGEMVNLLCGKNDLESASILEDLWNQVIETHSVPLLCSYSNHLLEPHESTGLPQRLLDAHSHIAA